MTWTLLRADEAYWRESNQMKVANTDLARQGHLHHPPQAHLLDRSFSRQRTGYIKPLS